jgi:hypothetical protein
MFSFQTITAEAESLKHKDDNGDFVQTDFDSEIENFFESIMNDGKMVRNCTIVPCGSRIVAVLSYSDMTDHEKKMLSAQKSGLHILEGKLS